MNIIIALDCNLNMEKEGKIIELLLATALILCFYSLKIPFSIVIFADLQFIYTIKSFEEEFSNKIIQRMIDCVFVKRKKMSRIAEVCDYVKKIKIQENNIKGVFIISNGYDYTLNYTGWEKIFNDKSNEFFCFIFIHMKLDLTSRGIVESTFENFRKEKKQIVIDKIRIDEIIEGAISKDFKEIFNYLNQINYENINKEKDSFEFEKNESNLNKEIKTIETIISYNKYNFIFDLNNVKFLQMNAFKNVEEKKYKNYNFPMNFIIEKLEEKIENFNKNFTKENSNLVNTLFPPNKPFIYVPSVKGNRLYILGLINFCLTHGQENKIWLEKKAGLKRDYRLTIIIDNSTSCFNDLMGKYSIQIILNFINNLSILDINYFDLIIAKKTPVLLCVGKEMKNCFYKPEILLNQLLLNLANPEKETNLNECLDILINIKNNSNSKKYFCFVFTDALFNNNSYQAENITNKLSICNYYGIDIYGIGLGFCPLKLPLVFPRCFWVSDPKNIISMISVLFGNDIETEKKLEVNYSK